MPFQFTGELPVMGSTEGVFRPSNPPAPSPSSPAQRAPSRSFASFGTTSSLSANSRRVALSSQESAGSTIRLRGKSDEHGAAVIPLDFKCKDDPILQALHRADIDRPAVLGKLEIAADKVVRDYLETIGGGHGGGGEGTRNVIHSLIGEIRGKYETLAETTRWLGLVWAMFDQMIGREQERAMRSSGEGKSKVGDNDRADGPIDQPTTVPYEIYPMPLCQREGDETIWIGNIYSGPAFLAAPSGKIQEEVLKRRWVRRYDENYAAHELAEHLCSGNTHREFLYDEIRWRRLGPVFMRDCPPPAVVEFVDTIYRIIQTLDKEFRAGWKVEGKEDASYFSGQEVSSTPQFARPKRVKEGCGCPKSQADTTTYRAEYLSEPFRFLDLPPELRSYIYKYALITNQVALQTCNHHLPSAVTPILTPGILSTSRLLNKEAAGLLEINPLIINLYIGGGCRQVIHRTQLPPTLASKITTLTLVVDAARTDFPSPQAMDWRQLQILTSLRHLRIAGISRSQQSHIFDDWELVLTKILTRVPADCGVEYGTKTELEKAHVGQLLKVKRERAFESGVLQEVPIGRLQEAARRIEGGFVRGYKCGVMGPCWKMEVD